MKDDSGSYAVFTEQGTSASQMTAAKVMDIISKLPGCSGQAADAVTSCTQLKMEDASNILKIPKWIRPPPHKWPKSWSSMEDPVVPLERNLYGHPLAGLLWERQFGTLLGKKFQVGNAYSYTVKKDYFYLCMWMTSNWLARKKTLIRCGKYSTNQSIWENQHNSLIMYTWDVLKNNVK